MFRDGYYSIFLCLVQHVLFQKKSAKSILNNQSVFSTRKTGLVFRRNTWPFPANSRKPRHDANSNQIVAELEYIDSPRLAR